MNLKKLAKIKKEWGLNDTLKSTFLHILCGLRIQRRKAALGFAP
jgi:hypothetical protein